MAGDSYGKTEQKTVVVRLLIRKQWNQVSEMEESLFDGKLRQLLKNVSDVDLPGSNPGR